LAASRCCQFRADKSVPALKWRLVMFDAHICFVDVRSLIDQQNLCRCRRILTRDVLVVRRAGRIRRWTYGSGNEPQTAREPHSVRYQLGAGNQRCQRVGESDARSALLWGAAQPGSDQHDFAVRILVWRCPVDRSSRVRRRGSVDRESHPEIPLVDPCRHRSDLHRSMMGDLNAK
jgi:hypothetical protein